MNVQPGVPAAFDGTLIEQTLDDRSSIDLSFRLLGLHRRLSRRRKRNLRRKGGGFLDRYGVCRWYGPMPVTVTLHGVLKPSQFAAEP